MDESPTKQAKTFKDKIKDRISLVKQQSTDFLLHARLNNSKQNEKFNEYQACLESLLPHSYQEDEIKQALSGYSTEVQVKETSQQLQERRKREDDFFLCVSPKEDKRDSVKSKGKKKKRSNSTTRKETATDEINKRLSRSTRRKETSTDEIIKSADKVVSPLKTALEYFDVELNYSRITTSSIISKCEDFCKAHILFWDGSCKPIAESTPNINISEDGFYIGVKPNTKIKHIKGVLSHSEDASEWFTSAGELIMEDYPIRPFNTEMQYIPNREVEMLTHHMDAVPFQESFRKLTEKFVEQSVLELYFGKFKFTHHSLFSIEHILAQQLTKYFDTYVKRQIDKCVKRSKELLFSLRNQKDILKQRLLQENENNFKKLYREDDFRRIVHDISKARKLHIEEATKDRNIEVNILKFWRNIKYVRKQLKFTSTSVVLEITKINTDIEEDRQMWEENFDLIISDIKEEYKCDYFEAKAKYTKNIRQGKSSLNTYEKPTKPLLDFDEFKVRKKLFNEINHIFRQPGEPIVTFKLSNSSEVITTPADCQNEIKRRADVMKTKLYIKVYVENKEVCRTKTYLLNEEFAISFVDRFCIRLPENIKMLKLLLFEQHSIFTPNLLSEIVIKIPEKNINFSPDMCSESIAFEIDSRRNYTHYGVGTLHRVADILNKKYSNISLHDVNITETLKSEGMLDMKLGWTSNYNDAIDLEVIYTNLYANINKKSLNSKKNLSNMVLQYTESSFDPNDPTNSFLLKFLDHIHDKNFLTDKFYINMFFNFEYILKKGSDSLLDIIGGKVEAGSNGKNKSQLSPYDVASTSDVLSRTPRESVLDDLSLANKVLDPVDLQRRTSIRYLQLVNEYLLLQSELDDKDKQLSDIVTIFKYPGIRSITVDFLRPKQPLFHQTRQPVVPLRAPIATVKDYCLRVCILKAFQLPCRSEGTQADTSINSDEGLKMISLRPFVRISCQGRSARTSTALGNNPTWNENLSLPVRNDSSSAITFHLFDEVFEDLLADNRLENTTVHFQYSANWLASLRIPLTNIFSQNKIEGTFLMYSPSEILGYKQNTEDKHTHSHISFDKLRKDVHMKQRDGFFLSLYLEIFPNLTEATSIPKATLESNEMDYMIKYLNTFTEEYNRQYPKRKTNFLVLDTCGKYVCITRLFKPLPLPEFGECLQNYFTSNVSYYEESESSRNSTPNRKKSLKNQENEDVTSRSVKSHFSGGDGRRQSKPVKDVFEMKSLDENLTDDGEKKLPIRMQACTRFVSLIPVFELNSFGNHIVALSGYQTLRLVCGTMLDHTILLMNYFMHLGVECWCVSGHALPRGLSLYVLVKENQFTNEMSLKDGLKSYPKVSGMRNKNAWKYCIYDATTGKKYDTKDPFCPLQEVYSISSNENIWVNIQPTERCSLTRFDLRKTSDWRPVFQKQVACPGPLPGPPSMGLEEVLYSYSGQEAPRLRDTLEDRIRSKLQKWRGHRRTIWNRHCCSVLKNTLVSWEKWTLSPSTPRPRNNQKLQQLAMSYQMYGFPFNMTYTTMRDIVSAIKATQIHLNEHVSVEFALGLEVFPYPNKVYSVWIYLTTLIKKV